MTVTYRVMVISYVLHKVAMRKASATVLSWVLATTRMAKRPEGKKKRNQTKTKRLAKMSEGKA